VEPAPTDVVGGAGVLGAGDGGRRPVVPGSARLDGLDPGDEAAGRAEDGRQVLFELDGAVGEIGELLELDPATGEVEGEVARLPGRAGDEGGRPSADEGPIIAAGRAGVVHGSPGAFFEKILVHRRGRADG